MLLCFICKNSISKSQSHIADSEMYARGENTMRRKCDTQWQLFKKTRGKGAEFAKNFRRNTFNQQILGNICQLLCTFHEKRFTAELRLNTNVIFLLKNCVWPLVSLLLPRIC